MARGRKKFYAIAQGNCAPMIAQSWATVEPLIIGVSGSKQKGFATFEEARAYLETEGHTTFYFHQGSPDGPKPNSSSKAWYAVVKGRQTGIRQTWEDTKLLTERSSGACHKSFATQEDAVAFLEAGLAALQLDTTSSYPDE